VTATVQRLTTKEILLGVALASTSGAAVMAHAFGPVKLNFAAPFIAMPCMGILVGTILLRRKLYDRLHAFASVTLSGGIYGLLATLVYDAVRPLIKWIAGYAFNPYRAMPVFGSLITGLPQTDPFAIGVGWFYHFWNGISFSIMYALIRPQGGAITGMLWGLGLQGLMMITYPTLLKLRLDTPGFLVMGIIGHALWGIVLGYCLKRWGIRW
jgi:hypothetical protein